MLDDLLSKTAWKERIERLAARLEGKVTPNQLTVLALLTGLGGAACVAVSRYALTGALLVTAVGLMVASFFFDVLDGSLARSTGQTSTFGSIADVFFDRLVEVAVLVALASTDPSTLLWPALCSAAATVLCITIYLLVGAAYKQVAPTETQKLLYNSRGLMERGETEAFLVLATAWVGARAWILWVFAALVLFTALQRFRIAHSLFRRADSKSKPEFF
ncbi:MAG: CDP-alcohol phosphatidyltransferase family protein [Promethearchaeota archaeon]